MNILGEEATHILLWCSRSTCRLPSHYHGMGSHVGPPYDRAPNGSR